MKMPVALTRFAEKLVNRQYVGQELAVSDDSVFLSLGLEPYQPDELMRKKGFEIYDKMGQDEQIDLCLSALITMRLSTGWDVIPASDSGSDKAVADFVKWNFQSFLKDSLEDDLNEIMSALKVGWSLSEKVYKPIEHGPHKGKIGLWAIKQKPPSMYTLLTDEFGNILENGVMRRTYPDHGKRFPVDKFVIYSFRKQYERVFGVSMLRALYDLWWLKHVVKRAAGVYVERYGIPVAVGKYPSTWGTEKQNALFRVLKKIRLESAAIVPEGVEMVFKETSGRSTDMFLKLIEHVDKQIAKKILGQTLTTEQGERGSQSLGRVHLDVLTMHLQDLGRDLAEKVINPQVVADLVDLNFANVKEYPRWKFNPLPDSSAQEMADKYLAAVEKGVILATERDEEYLRSVFGFPDRKPDDVLHKKAVTPQFQPPPPPAPPAAPDVELAEPRLDAKIMAGVTRRKLTKYEQRYDFAEAVRAIEDDGVSDILADIVPTLRESVERMIRAVDRQKILQKADLRAVRELSLHNQGEIRRDIADGLLRVVRRGRRSARNEISRARKRDDLFEFGFGVEPEQVLAYFKNKAFTITGDITHEVTKKIQLEITKGIKAGSSIKEIQDGIEEVLAGYFEVSAKSGVAALDVGSRLETIIRTNTVEAFEMARNQEAMASDYVVGFQYSAILDDRVRPNHEYMDERIYRKTSPVWDDWMPPAGFNCFVPGTMVEGTFLGAMRGFYSGETVSLRTRSGLNVTVTPNHPILTAHGFVAANLLRKGDDLVCNRRHVKDALKRPAILVGINKQNRPAAIEEIFRSFLVAGVFRQSALGNDFHGDGRHIQGDVDIVGPAGELLAAIDSARQQREMQLVLKTPATENPLVGRSRASNSLGTRTLPPAHGFMGGADLSHDGVASGGPDLPPLQSFGFGASANINASRYKLAMQGRSADAGFIADLFERFSADIFTDEIVEIRNQKFVGHVYDLQSPYGWIVANGIYSSNCRCTRIFVTKADGWDGTEDDPPTQHPDAGFGKSG